MSKIVNDSISDLLNNDVKTKSNRIRGSSSYTKKPPEVMVKVSGFGYNSAHTMNHFDYISRNGKLELEDETGLIYQNQPNIHQLAKDWSNTDIQQRFKTRHNTHLVLSMPFGTEPKTVKQAVRSFAKKTFAENHQYVFALHTDTDSPHVHLTVKNLGFDGKRLHVRKGLPQIWREQFANELESLGIAAEATPSFKKIKFRDKQVSTLAHESDANDTSIER
ncbi:relaxase/mobilization nuclease domain-containing protein [Shewanella sp. 202IG2-18]|uniref:relaxase/mobilization nuclease domain-containing protein n=1 Tax=Parashewanella hymeniacidonis TaxID=2807618 RepID=UPI00195F66CC|nr:relaxase/mobilization nuclease domain-containing protein [Parashewanella hymeniacidonis]MBM7070744.1 relaxase/mobilization nuclease domain-containing protein [Parashewanella hymeniacidonis]